MAVAGLSILSSSVTEFLMLKYTGPITHCVAAVSNPAFAQPTDRVFVIQEAEAGYFLDNTLVSTS